MYAAGFWKCVLFPAPSFLSASFAGVPWLPGCIGATFHSPLCPSRCSPGLCWEHIPALLTGSSGKPEDSVSLDDGLIRTIQGRLRAVHIPPHSAKPFWHCWGSDVSYQSTQYPDCKSNDCQEQTCCLQGNDKTYKDSLFSTLLKEQFYPCLHSLRLCLSCYLFFVSFLISIVLCILMCICTCDYIALLLLNDTGY